MRTVFGRMLSILLPLSAPVVAQAACHPAPHSNIGCDFYAVTLPNDFVDQSSNAFYLVALNPSASATASVQVSGGALAMPLDAQVPPGEASGAALPWVGAVSTASGTQLVAGGAYHVSSDLPLSVVQFNTGTPGAGSNDATLLMPVQNAGRSFRTNLWPEWGLNGSNEPAQIGIVATRASTTVDIAGANLQPGAGLTASGGSLQMDAGDVLLLTSALTEGVDLSGMLISASAPVIAFASHSGTQVPTGTSYGDHLEDWQPPLPELGSRYVLVRPSDPGGGNGARQYVKLVGTADNTTLTWDPAVSGAPASIGAGQAVAFELTADTSVTASQPVAVSQFMEGAGAFDGNFELLGDPSQLTSIPPNRGALDIDFIAPTALASIHAQVVAPTGAQVSIDGNEVSGWTAIGSSGYSAADVTLCCVDAHHATGTLPFTLSVYAYPAAGTTSYWYAGGWGASDGIFGDGFDSP